MSMKCAYSIIRIHGYTVLCFIDWNILHLLFPPTEQKKVYRNEC